MYIEEILKDLNKNIKEINEKLEKLLGTALSVSDKTNAAPMQEKVIAIDERQAVDTTQQAQGITQAQDTATVETQVIPTAIETFTREDIAKAMASAMDMGKMDVIQNILTTYNAQSLMDIAPENYGSIALMLREAGVKI